MPGKDLSAKGKQKEDSQKETSTEDAAAPVVRRLAGPGNLASRCSLSARTFHLKGRVRALKQWPEFKCQPCHILWALASLQDLS